MIAGPSGIGAPSAGINVTIALGGTVPVTSELVAAGEPGAGEGAGVLEPHAEVSDAATIMMNVVERMMSGW
jgi:hypothetical protein